MKLPMSASTTANVRVRLSWLRAKMAAALALPGEAATALTSGKTATEMHTGPMGDVVFIALLGQAVQAPSGALGNGC